MFITNNPWNLRVALSVWLVLLGGCVGIPEHVQPVESFDVKRYLGTWYEIARLDNRFERGLEKISATYSARDDDGIRVLNKGYDIQRKAWREAEGRAYFVDRPSVGRLKVSFFGPFYGAYNVIELDRENYRYALICGSDKEWLWILSRSKILEKSARSVNRESQDRWFRYRQADFCRSFGVGKPFGQSASFQTVSSTWKQTQRYSSRLESGSDC